MGTLDSAGFKFVEFERPDLGRGPAGKRPSLTCNCTIVTSKIAMTR